MPSDQVAASIPVAIAGMNAMVPSALLRVGRGAKNPDHFYNTGLDDETGQRRLTIEAHAPSTL